MSFGIQGKVALLVVLATAASALLVAKVLTHRAAEVLREHELVDLGDEASLRGWTIIDQIDALRDDLIRIAFNADFRDSVALGKPPKELNALASSLGRRNWANHLRLDVVTLDPTGLRSYLIHSRAEVAEKDVWFPGPDTLAGARLHYSAIERIQLTRTEPGTDPVVRWEPVVWALAPLDRSYESGSSQSRYIRIMMTLHANESPRHLFALVNSEGELIVRHDETEPEERGNDNLFAALGKDPELLAALEARRAVRTDPSRTMGQSKVDRLVRHEHLPLTSPYFFQEGIPGKTLTAAVARLSDEEHETFMDSLQAKVGTLGRVGGLRSGVRELRLLGHSPENLQAIREQVESHLRSRFAEAYDGVAWRNEIECDEIHSWTVRLLIGEGQSQEEYLIHYAVLDDELASSIEYEMLSVQYIALIVAGGFGILGFFFAMRFIRPLKQMTLTAQKITESPREELVLHISALVKRLDIRRGDEVGDIARASKRLFEELIRFQEDLEQRVNDRTRELRRTNIELEKANDKLKSLSHEKDAFVAKVSHDLRQPLNAIFLQVEALKLSTLDEAQQKDVQRIRDHAARELNLVNDILEYQKIIMGAETFHKDTIAIQPLLEDLVATYQSACGTRPVTLAAEVSPEIGSLVADERRLRQILGNLVGNACKFTFEGSVTLAARPQEISGCAWVEFTITDTGRGMSPAEQAKAFVPFVSNKKDNTGGSGLGLTICRELVSQMGGKIGFVSELGKGTHFSVFLPREPSSEHYERRETPDFADLATSLPEADRERKVSRGSTILVIDDDEKVRDLLERILTNDGHRVLTAEDGNSGLRLAEEHRPDAITLDVVMPGGKDGWEVLRTLKDSPATQSIPVIMVSVMAEQENGLALDVEDYLVKPIDVERLSRVISRVTQRSPQRNLLLVDDDVDSLESMSRILEAAGWSTTLAHDGVEALAVLDRTRPAAIILDLIMPGMDGFAFLDRLREDPHLKSIPVIVMSGKDPTRDEQTFLRDRVSAVLKKGSHSSGDLLASIKARLRPAAAKPENR
ncbi:MAG: response regulator [Verrucomicrobiaceae bacterium]|nr:response regulator [Verrucomicrobiaceae bacterium]